MFCKMMPAALTAGLLGFTGSLTGCMGGEESGEVRIDAFSVHWRELQANADSSRGLRVYDDGNVLELRDASLDKTASLPKHVLGENQGHVYVHFPLEGDSRDYVCGLRIESELTYMDSTEFARSGLTQDDVLFTETAPGAPKAYLARYESVEAPARSGLCVWVPGKGLYLDAGAPFEGEIIVKY